MNQFKKTKSVKLLLDEFTKSNQALSVVDLVKTFKSEMNKTTVYRVLERLEEKEILHSFTGKDGLRWYAKREQSLVSSSVNSHPHFQCDVCGKSECLSIDFSIPNIPNYNIVTADVLLSGQCNDCISI